MASRYLKTWMVHVGDNGQRDGGGIAPCDFGDDVPECLLLMLQSELGQDVLDHFSHSILAEGRCRVLAQPREVVKGLRSEVGHEAPVEEICVAEL